MLEGIDLDGYTVLADKGFAGEEFEAFMADLDANFLRPDRKGEPIRYGALGAVRQWIESIFWTCKGQLTLERHGGRTHQGLAARIALRLLALAAALWHNEASGSATTSARHRTPASGKINQHKQPTRGGATSSRRAGANASRRAEPRRRVRDLMIRVILPITNNHFGWMGGLNYIRSLATAVVQHGSGYIEPYILAPTHRPPGALSGFASLQTVETSLLDVHRPAWAVRSALSRTLQRDVGLERALRRLGAQLLSHHPPLGRGARIPTLSWIPDLQHLRFPEFIAPREIAALDRGISRMVRWSAGIVISSKDARSDLLSKWPQAEARVHVLHFVPDSDPPPVPTSAVATQQRYGIGDFLYLPNQLWAHKNHAVVIEALGLLLADGRPITVVCTGDPVDIRNPDYAQGLLSRATELGLGENFRMLGRVPYADVGALLAASRGLVNPSLFEGWSTTVEEAKSVGKRAVVSDISVHREQDPAGAIYASPRDPAAFADAMWRLWTDWDPADDDARRAVATADLSRRRAAFATSYEDICASITC